MKQLGRSAIAATIAIGAVLAACTASGITGTDQDASTISSTGKRTGKLATNLIECPANQTTSATSVLGPLGGVVSVGGTSISIPAGALLSSVEVTVTVPQSNLMEIDISVAGSEHFLFALPATVTLSYARCNRGDINFTPLSVWYIDSETKALLEHMGGIDNKLLKTVTFVTPHLSGWAIAN